MCADNYFYYQHINVDETRQSFETRLTRGNSPTFAVPPPHHANTVKSSGDNEICFSLSVNSIKRTLYQNRFVSTNAHD